MRSQNTSATMSLFPECTKIHTAQQALIFIDRIGFVTINENKIQDNTITGFAHGIIYTIYTICTVH